MSVSTDARARRPFGVPGGVRSLQGLAMVALGVLLATGSPLSAQTAPERLQAGCAAGAPGSEPLARRCADAALAAQALQGGIGLLMTAGGPIPASPSTAGRRLSTQPRVIVDAGLGWASFRHPDLGGLPSQGRIEDRRTTAVGPRVAAAVGLFEGFSPLPGVGGVLAVDAVGLVQYLRLAQGAGFSESTAGWGAGARIGVVRESFSLPGLTISAMHLRLGRIRNGTVESAGARVALHPRATSIRAIVGKDLWTVGLSAGIAWDRYGGTSRIEARVPNPAAPPGPEFLEGAGGPVDLVLRRRAWFAGANFTWIVTQVAAELVWAETTRPRDTLVGSGPYRPGERELQGSLSVRVQF